MESQHLFLIFSPSKSPKPQIFGPFSDLEKFRLQMFNNADVYLYIQTTLNRHRSPTKFA